MSADFSQLAASSEALPMVVQTQLNLTARRVADLPHSGAPCLQASVLLRGMTADGVVRLQLPDSLAIKAATILFGEPSTPAGRRDIAGELCNMIAGRIAAEIKDQGGAFTLETPSVDAGTQQTLAPGQNISRADWDCDGDWLTLEIQIHGKEHAT